MSIITIGLNPAIDRIVAARRLVPGEHLPVTQLTRLAAGKAANVSRALALCGKNSTAMGFLGRSDADWFARQLTALGPGTIRCRFIKAIERTRENVTILDAATGVETHLRETGCPVGARAFQQATVLLKKTMHRGDTVIFAGSLPPGFSTQQMATLLKASEAAGCRIAVDTSGAALKAALRCPLWLIKPNLEELSELLGRRIRNNPQAISAAADPLLKTVENILVSRGAAGAVLVRRDGFYTGRLLKKVKIVRTVACGDHLLAGFVAAAVDGATPTECLRYALLVATARAMSRDFGTFGTLLSAKAVEVWCCQAAVSCREANNE
ncbi:MAG: 1-phosphofructokinase family hexose kinase [Phycisphaerales bacterium]|nr:1-phosphofructokinase family hexose kinase [Phycisphaerales bacterium]